jgi:UDP-2,3-diacylglucosamine hydrolase
VTERLFISDLHLDPSRPRATSAFLRFLRSDARRAERLYILGDLFEFWIGDDDDDPHSGEVLDALRDYTASGRACLVMRGNRDFLLGARFGERTGTQLLTDPTVEDVFGTRVLIMHGDQLCTDDRAYQRYRRIVNNVRLQRLFLALPRAWRRAAGVEGRRRSRAYAASGQPGIADVSPAAVAEAMAQARVNVLLHGHTHRPAIHRLDLKGVAGARIVLGDWYEQGSVLRWSPSGYDLTALPFG